VYKLLLEYHKYHNSQSKMYGIVKSSSKTA